MEAKNLEVMPFANEIKDAMWSCDPSKAPGPDIYNMNFIRKNWEVVGEDI